MYQLASRISLKRNLNNDNCYILIAETNNMALRGMETVRLKIVLQKVTGNETEYLFMVRLSEWL